MSLVGYAEEFFRPAANVKINNIGKIIKPPKRRLLSSAYLKVRNFFNEWTQHSYEAWVKAGKPADY